MANYDVIKIYDIYLVKSTPVIFYGNLIFPLVYYCYLEKMFSCKKYNLK